MNVPDPQTLGILLAATLVPSWIASWFSLIVIRRLAPKLGLLDRPGQGPDARKDHAQVTPLGGGLGIWCGVVTTFAAATLLVVLSNQLDWLTGLAPDFLLEHRAGILSKLDTPWVVLGAATVLAVLGLMDDRYGLNWKLRLFVQFGIAAVCVAWQGWRITAFINIPVLTAALSVIWIVALINAFNMLDNMDGLSGGVALISAAVLASVLLLANEPGGTGPQIFVASFLLVIVGSIGGFLAHNLPPARIFMGDAGSYLIGFMIAVATLLATFTGYRSSTPHAILAPMFVMAVPFYDMISVIVIRLRQGVSPFHADKNHLSHRLVDLGLSRWQSVLTIYLLTATCGIGALLLQRVDTLGAVLLTMLIICELSLIAILETTARKKLRT